MFTKRRSSAVEVRLLCYARLSCRKMHWLIIIINLLCQTRGKKRNSSNQWGFRLYNLSWKSRKPWKQFNTTYDRPLKESKIIARSSLLSLMWYAKSSIKLWIIWSQFEKTLSKEQTELEWIGLLNSLEKH